MEEQELLSSEARKALLPAWALDKVRSHTPQQPDDRGLTCDERGCMVCNIGDEAVEVLVEQVLTGVALWPEDLELIEAVVELAGLLEDSLDYEGCKNCGAPHGLHEGDCFPCPAGRCDQRFTEGRWGCHGHASEVYAEHVAEMLSSRI